MRKVAIIIIVTIVLSAITYAGGGIVVTQGNCCNGSGGTGVADGVGIYSVTAKNLLSNDNDSTVVDGGIADRNTIKDMRLFEYILARNDTAANLYQSLQLGNTKIGIPAIGFFHSKNNGFNFMGSYDNGTKYGGSSIASFNNIGIGGGINLDTNHTEFFYVGDIYDAVLNANNNRFVMTQVNKITNDLFSAIAMDSSSQIVYEITMPLTAGNSDPVTQIRQDRSFVSILYNPSNNPNYPATDGGITIAPNGNPNTEIKIENLNGEYLLNSAGQHLFTSVAATTASFNGDIEATAFNIISDVRLKENIKDYSNGIAALSQLQPKTYDYDGVIRVDSTAIYDTTYTTKSIKVYRTASDNDFVPKELDTRVWLKDKQGEYRIVESKVPNVKIVGYDTKEVRVSNKGCVGLLAQDVEKVLPSAVNTNEYGMKSIDYTELVILLINANKELEKRIKELENR